VIENFRLKKGGGACNIIFEKKTHPPHALLGDRKISVAIQWWGCVGW
jgi:hypothetical protein